MIVVLLVVLVVLAAIGLYGVAIQSGWLGERDKGRERDDGDPWWRRGEGRFSEYLEAVPPGCIVSLMVLMGLWIVAWLVFLVVGLNFLWSVK